MRIFLTSLLTAGVILFSDLAGAQDQEPELVTTMMHPDGRPGVWLELGFAQHILEQVGRVPHLEEQLRIAGARLELKLAEIETLSASLAAVANDRDQIAEQLQLARSFWHSDPLWFGFGSAAASIVFLLLGGI